MVDKRKHLFMGVFQLINKKEMIEHHHFAVPSELTDLGIDHQQQLTSQKGRLQTFCAFGWKTCHQQCIILPKGSNWSLIKTLDPTTNFQEIPSSEEHVKLFLEYVISKIRTVRNFTGLKAQVLKQKNFIKTKGSLGGIYRLKMTQKTYQVFKNWQD